MVEKKAIIFLIEEYQSSFGLYHSHDAKRNGTELDSTFLESLHVGKKISLDDLNYTVVDFKFNINDDYVNFILYVKEI